jgi:lipopolysaccharide export system permease protein
VKGDDELGGVSIYAFNDQRRLQSVRYAASAKFDPATSCGVCRRLMNLT